MKKFVLCMLVAGLMTPAIAQEKTVSFPKNGKVVLHEKERFDLGISTTPMLPTSPTETMVEVEGWTVAGVSKIYDRQTQGSVYPMTKRHDDGFIGCTWTTEDNSPFPGSSVGTRGIGYSYSTDNGATWSVQENRVGGIPLYWPSYAQWGANGEAILGRSADTHVYQGVQIKNGLVLLTRENKGQGEWTITPVPYPAGTSPNDGYIMAWARMATSGDKHQYIHIMSPMRGFNYQPYKGYDLPVFYYRTQDGGSIWDIEGKLVPEMVGGEWDAHSQYSDAISFADAKGDMVACSFIDCGSDGYVLKSYDNGDTWESIKFFDSPVGYHIPPSQYADTCFIPVRGCIALDNENKIHVAFTVVYALNMEDEGYFGYFIGAHNVFLSYWNEDMEPINGATEFIYSKVKAVLDDYFDWELSDDEKLYVKSTIPRWPVIGYFTPLLDEGYFYKDMSWYFNYCYGIGESFSYPQMIFDRDNTLHLTYLGILESDDDLYRFMHHPFYTATPNGGENWTKTKHLVDNINLIDWEFAYLTLSGIDDSPKQWMHLTVQVDGSQGTYIHPIENGYGCQIFPSDNYFYHFQIQGDDIELCAPVIDASAAVTCTAASLTWTAVPEAKKYRISRDGVVFTTFITATDYIETGEFEEGKSYTWRIAAVGDNIESGEVEVTAIATCVGIHELANSIAIYPNPTTGKLTIDNGNLIMEKIEIFDVFGRKLSTLNSQLSTQQIDVSSYNTGIYFFKVYDASNNSVTKRVMVTK
jgi:hypothetical protein